MTFSKQEAWRDVFAPPHVHLNPPLIHVIAYCLHFIHLHIQLCTNGTYNFMMRQSFEINTFKVTQLCV